VEISEDERRKLEALLRAGTAEQRLVKRARIVLLAAEGLNNEEIAQRCQCNVNTAKLWRNRWRDQGLEGLKDTPGRGRKKIYVDQKEAEILAATLERPDEPLTHWSARRLAEQIGVPKSTILRVWKRNRLQPHRQETFKYSNDPLLVEKVIDLVGLYLDPPEKALVLSVDEKCQVQALERTQDPLPMRPGNPETRTHDYKRHGTTTLFAALNVATGEVIGQFEERHRHQELLRFLQTIDEHYPDGEIHLIIDNYSPHKHPSVKEWFARRPRYHLHFTPTSASWMNQIETWFSLLGRQAIRRGSFKSLPALMQAINRFIEHWNQGSTPFKWVKSADEILARAVR
jgi:transposase